MKTYERVKVQLHAFLNLTIHGGEWLSSLPGRFSPREKPQHPLDRRLGEPQSRSGRRNKKKNSLPLLGIEP
jgi:hypothetical protein